MTSSGIALDDIPARILCGETPRTEEFLAFLSVPEADLRAERLAALSFAFAQTSDPAREAILAKRAFAVSGYDRRYLDPCLEALQRVEDLEGIREALKRAGIELAKQDRTMDALELFNRSLYTFATYRREDRYAYDFEMLEAIEAQAERYRAPRFATRTVGNSEKARIGVLVFGALHIESIVIKILAALAEHVDRDRFDIAFFVPEAANAVRRSSAAQAQLALLGRPGWKVCVPDTDDPFQVLLDTAAAIVNWGADALLTAAMCADLRHYFIACQRPAPKTIGLVLGPPPQFTAPWVDWNIAVSAHPSLDCPGNCTVAPLELTLASRETITPASRERFDLAPGNKVLLSAGRFTKFESAWYWRAIAEILSGHPEVVYLVVGIDELPKVARNVMNEAVAGRIRTIGWQRDYLQFLALADLVLDTYPSGGGGVLMDAMAFGIPVVSFANDYLHEFDQTDWSLGNEFVGIPDLVVARGDFAALVSTVGRLLADPAEASRLGVQCRALVAAHRGDPSRMIKGWEAVFERVTKDLGTDVSALSDKSANRFSVLTGDARAAGRPPLVSIITPTYNRADFLAETIESVLTQDYPHIEFIVLDDGSTDATPALLDRYSDRLLAVRHPNMGETATVNRGLAMARGEVICVVNSDDPLLPQAISTAVRYLADHPEVLAAYPDWVEIDPDSKVVNTVRLPEYDLAGMLRDFNVAMGPGTFFRREALEKIGFRKGTLRYTGDLDFWFRIARVGHLGHIEAVLATHRTHPGAASSAERGKRMAAEIPLLAEGVFSGGTPIPGLSKHKTYATAYWSAARYCGNALGSRLAYMLRAWAWHPGEAIRLSALELAAEHLRAFGPLWRWIRRRRGEKQGGKEGRFAIASHVLPPSWSGQATALGRVLAPVGKERYCLIATAASPAGSVSRLSATRLEAPRYALSPEPWPAFWSRAGMIGWLDTLFRVMARGWKIARILRAEKCNAVIAASGDLIDLPAAYLASRIAGVAFVPYLFDDYAEQWGFAPWLKRRAQFIESRILPRAAAVIVPNEFLQEEILRRYGKSPAIVRNPCEAGGLDHDARSRQENDEIKIVYTGAIYHANASAFRLLLDGIRLCASPRVALHLYTAQSPDTLAQEGIAGEGIVHHAHVPPEEVGETQSAADILFLGFAFDSPIPEVVRTSAPGKLGDYLAAGRPILAIAPENAFLTHYLEKHRCGKVVVKNDPQSVAEAINELVADRDLVNRLADNALQRAKIDFNPIRASAVLVETMKSCA